ncbi:hypothetical protein AO1008_04676 [Aspergillus oryzae 100-8]|uniref:Uncharacterized protein n=1 Tax=Aspergillus oryzae (strain 3.042) TaxID=1160506 RepID=I8A3X2_ASPO3|nr:hypothetical protein Ao3042_03868 [Aspergillus oryzae 3.042]KDE78352.1 hypothetical protein AO1008_04676 [Aspergillus oryzae 100-8]|eukprot:EIT79657.1 hypothetical protein Ao3042_03868 [Aspergillus oryzae 3.042]
MIDIRFHDSTAICNTIVNYAINKTSEPVIGFLLRNDDNCVTKVTAYVGRYEPTGVDILYGIELTYKDGKRSIRVGTRGESSKSLSLGHGEKISHMVIRATDRVDGLEVKTNRDQHSTERWRVSSKSLVLYKEALSYILTYTYRAASPQSTLTRERL